MNKRKIFNDPVYGFISIPYDRIFDIIEHPFFQRLRRIQQLGLSHYVYPGANHTRFQHALGAMHLMGMALHTLKSKGVEITDEECFAATAAILLHDVGHGPYSHALERSIVPKINHEQLSIKIIELINSEMDGDLSTCLQIFKGEYSKHFLHQLVSSQLDMDRMDYLNRDSYFTGVQEGVIGSERILKMLDVVNDELVVEAKGVYSIEKFIVARRLMYWQVYLHRTVLCAEQMLIKALERAKYLAQKGEEVFGTEALRYFLYLPKDQELDNSELLMQFSRLDDYDVFVSLKTWQRHEDKILSYLCKAIVNRKLFRIQLQKDAFQTSEINKIREKIAGKFGIADSDIDFLLIHDTTSNSAYNQTFDKINIKYKDGTVLDVAKASDQLNIHVLSEPVVKHYICYPKDLV